MKPEFIERIKRIAKQKSIRVDDFAKRYGIKSKYGGPKAEGALKETFGTLNFKKSTGEMLKESDRESWD